MIHQETKIGDEIYIIKFQDSNVIKIIKTKHWIYEFLYEFNGPMMATRPIGISLLNSFGNTFFDMHSLDLCFNTYEDAKHYLKTNLTINHNYHQSKIDSLIMTLDKLANNELLEELQ